MKILAWYTVAMMVIAELMLLRALATGKKTESTAASRTIGLVLNVPTLVFALWWVTS